ncbi:MAG: electron transfer flavoprotein subunit alpha/FixB family protein [Candidatus Melainabacteria bacterium]|jgi:electron transfer flavoprotein alpha subunit|nr:electron transfer flavoprotein subunit alpha/FixB family protein [Candidatus Melainabacteria bacterium]MBX9674030.1 electron transfer flavoprotein subunit alpha/FixB family protein [Candidatus Obscuribacterales bacterium]
MTDNQETQPDVSQFCPKGDVLVIGEQILGDLQPVTLELLGAGRILADKMGQPLKCLIMGHNLGDIPQRLIEYGADEVFVADSPELHVYRTLPYRRVVCDFLDSLSAPPHTCLLGSTTTGRDLAPRIAAHFETGLTADCTELDIGPYEHKSKVDPTKIGLYPNCLYAIRPSFGESLKARILGPWKNPQMATTRPGVMVPNKQDPNRQGKITPIPVNLKQEDFRLIVADTVREISKGVKLTEADVIVAGGFGLGGPEGFDLLRELAAQFENSAVAASRKVVDLGWIPYQHQVGQTGKTVRPKLYIAAGISGAIQHRVGMSKSGIIIAINKDPDSPIFKFAHHGIVGDCNQVISEMIKQLKAVKSGKGVEAVVGSH